MSEKFYRKCIVAVIVNDNRLLFCGERSDIPGAWQLPQGGIDEGEDAKQALYRELEEEIGTNQVELIDNIDKPLKYDWPRSYFGNFSGQEQWFFLVKILNENKINLNASKKPEFADYKWLNIEDFLKMSHGFKTENYKKALYEFKKRYPNYIS